MRGIRDSGFVISLALVASLVGHYAIQRHFERRTQTIIARSPSADEQLLCPEFDLSELDELELPVILCESQASGGCQPPDSCLSYLPFTPKSPKTSSQTSPQFAKNPRSPRQIIPTVDVQENEARQSPVNPPNSVPAPTDATRPGNSETDESVVQNNNSSAVRDVIEDELAHTSPDEREIWFDELKTLPAGVVRELLQVRKQLRALPRLLGGMPEKLASADAAMPSRLHEIAAEPASQKIQFNLTDLHPAATALEKAVSQLRHNITNAATPGFKRLRVTLVDAYGSGWQESATQEQRADSSIDASIQGEGCRVAPLLLDLKQGPLKKTDRQFDLAVDGEGFFVVRRGEKDYLTRCGAFTLDRDRQLSLAITNDLAVLQPAIKFPDDAREIQISADGLVTILKSGETTLIQIGQLQLGRVASPARLQPTGNTLFAANESSGVVVFEKPMSNGLGELQQGCLEQSNVDFTRELDEIDELTKILKTIPLQNSHSATARSLQHAPQR